MDLNPFFRPEPYDHKIRLQFRNLKVDNFDNQRIFLSANAGAGKTYEIMQFIRTHRKYSILLLSYTRSVVADIKKKLQFGGHVDVMTYDALCLKNRNIMLGDQRPDGSTFCSDFTARKIYRRCLDETYDGSNTEKWVIKHKLKTLYDICKKDKVQNTRINKALILYDYAYKEYDVVIVDEAQDLDILKRMFFEKQIPTKAKIFVGDPKQSLYCDTNIFETNKVGDLCFKLTHTFRYGTQLIDLLNNQSEKHTAFPVKKTRVVIDTLANHLTDVKLILISAWKHILDFIPFLRESLVTVDSAKLRDIEICIEKHRLFQRWNDKWTQQLGPRGMADKTDFFEHHQKEYLLEFENNKWEELSIVIKNRKKRKRGTGPKITTVHKAKGLEETHVYLHKSCFPEHNTNPCSIHMKDKIYYTALTRCKMSVIFEGAYVYAPFHFTNIERELLSIKNGRTAVPLHEWQSFQLRNSILGKFPRITKQLQHTHVG